MILPPPTIEKLFRQYLAENQIQQPDAQIKAEGQLLHQSVEAALGKLFDAAQEDQAFSRDVAPLVNKSPKAISTLTYQELLAALATPDQALILMRPHKKEDVIWQGKGTDKEWRGFVRPFPVNPDNLAIRSHQIHYSVTRGEITNWNRAATTVPTSSLEAFMRFLKNHSHRIRAVVADKDDVMVIFNVVASDYPSWRKSTIELWHLLTKRGVNAERFRLGRLVPISRESRGRGALLYLAA